MPLGILVKSLHAELLLRGGEGAMIGRDHLQRACCEPGPQAVLMRLVAEGRAHHPARRMVPFLVEIFGFIEGQMLNERLAIDAHALLARAPDRLMRLLAMRCGRYRPERPPHRRS